MNDLAHPMTIPMEMTTQCSFSGLTAFHLLRTVIGFILVIIIITASAYAGPPFKTDDPQPVDFRHWEFYVASVQQYQKRETNLTAPHIEINYGVIPDVQLHLVAPLAYVRAADGPQYGYSDTELGIKLRVVEETETVPQVGIFPIVEVPTGNESKQLGSGTVQVYCPVWIQKSWGRWTTYGGAGFWYNPGADAQNWIFTGWELQYDFSKTVTLGGELCYQTADASDAQSSVSFNAGGFVNISDAHHLLFSIGHSLSGPATVTGYLGYQLTM